LKDDLIDYRIGENGWTKSLFNWGFNVTQRKSIQRCYRHDVIYCGFIIDIAVKMMYSFDKEFPDQLEIVLYPKYS
jgi:hypothetical protein